MTAGSEVVYLNPPDLDERRKEAVRTLASAQTPHSEVFQTSMGMVRKTSPAGPIVFSAPHEFEQMRDGQPKVAEQGTAEFAFGLAAVTGLAACSTAGPQQGDPNWDFGHPYLGVVSGLVPPAGAIIDLHMMRPRGFEVCLGLGPDHEKSRWVWEPLLNELLAADVRVALNWPFGARGRSVIAQASAFNLVGVQVEMSFEIFNRDDAAQWCVLSALVRAAEAWKREHFGGLPPVEQ